MSTPTDATPPDTTTTTPPTLADLQRTVATLTTKFQTFADATGKALVAAQNVSVVMTTQNALVQSAQVTAQNAISQAQSDSTGAANAAADAQNDVDTTLQIISEMAQNLKV